jgi:hypothetical protein
LTSFHRFGSHKLTPQWDLALNFAKQCLEKFQLSVSSVEDIEKQSSEAIELLMKRHVHDFHVSILQLQTLLSCSVIPRYAYFSGKEDPLTSDELKDLAYRIVKQDTRNC